MGFDRDTLGSSALQADKLQALLQTMANKKSTMEDLLHLSSQLSVHLSDAESLGALLAQLGDVHEEWRLLEGSIKRASEHASNTVGQYSVLIQEVKQLKAKLQNFHGSKSTFQRLCQQADLKLYSQHYVHFHAQVESLAHFSLGQKEKDEISRSLQELKSLLNVTKSQLDSYSYTHGEISSARTNQQVQDLIMWAKQAENRITVGQKLSLFPQESHIQIDKMKKFQTDFWSKRSKLLVELGQMEESHLEKTAIYQILKATEELYDVVVHDFDQALDSMKKNLKEREQLFFQLANTDVWLDESQANRNPQPHVYSISKTDIGKLESELESHRLATAELENRLKLVEAVTDTCREIAAGLSPGESRYLVNRLSGIWTELDGLLAHEKATSWELEELILERTTSDEELSNIQASLNQISTALEQQRFPLTQENLLTIEHLTHTVIQHQCEVQELQHCQEAKRSSLLCTIGTLQDRCKSLSVNAFEQDKYLRLRRQMEESTNITKDQIQHAKDETLSVGERFRQCQTLLVELPLVKTQCQEAVDQLEIIAQELFPSELKSERQGIIHTVDTLLSWEHSVTEDIKSLENELLPGLHLSSEFPALVELLRRIRVELQEVKPVNPDEKVIDITLQRYWLIWRNMESGMRVLEGLGAKERINLKNLKELYSLKNAAQHECQLQMVRVTSENI